MPWQQAGWSLVSVTGYSLVQSGDDVQYHDTTVQRVKSARCCKTSSRLSSLALAAAAAARHRPSWAGYSSPSHSRLDQLPVTGQRQTALKILLKVEMCVVRTNRTLRVEGESFPATTAGSFAASAHYLLPSQLPLGRRHRVTSPPARSATPNPTDTSIHKMYTR